MKQGRLTAQVSRALSDELARSFYQVLFDHGDPAIDPPDQLGQIASWFGLKYTADSRLALLDLAVVDRDTDDALLLVEIEESAASPKVILGDVMGTLLGDRVTFQGQRELNVGAWSHLIVLVRGETDPRTALIRHVTEQVQRLKPRLTTSNASIGEVIIETFATAADLERKLLAAVGERMC